jgi:hypothetical protein
MPNALVNVRSFLVRGLAVMAVLLTYCVGGVVTQVASVVGISSLALLATAKPAQAGYRRSRRRSYRGGGGYGYGY